MKTLTLTTALIAALAVPVLANADTAAEIFATEAASQDELVLTGSSSAGGAADAIFMAETASDDDRIGNGGAVGSEVISTQSFGTNAVAARIFAAENAASREDE